MTSGLITWLQTNGFGFKGNNTSDNYGVYGTKGNSSTTNNPGGRNNSTTVVDHSGRFWLFGGYGKGPAGDPGVLNDLWQYNPATNNWIWISGDNFADGAGNYGTQGIPGIFNIPAARAGSVSWVDGLDNFWIFGGLDSLNSSSISYFNDLWEYNLINNSWTWMKGDSIVNAAGSPGVKGTSSLNNNPMAKGNGVSWIDNSGSLWMYGGTGINWWGNLNDLWKYDLNANEWTWIKGETSFSDPGVFGLKGVADNKNLPGAREDAVSWTDTSGNLWLFGGRVIHQVDLYSLNDLWKYEPAVNQWIWMKGDSIPNGRGLYVGPADATQPGARRGSVTWTDNLGNLWLFGGEHYDRNTLTFTLFNDLWKYDPGTNNWTWIAGDSTGNGPGIYGTKGVGTSFTKPGARGGSVSWKDSDGNLWLFGGWSGTSGNSDVNLNDLWKYDISANTWTWVNGDNIADQDGDYGSLGVPSASNKPGARCNGVSWSDSTGKLWLFGGDHVIGGNNLLFDDLWKYDPLTNKWTWISGDNITDANGYYTVTGEYSHSNKPGARAGSVVWKDIYGHVFLLGGYGNSTSEYGWLNDFWEYDPSTNEWAFLNNDSTYASSTVNKPGSRYFGVSWADPFGDFWFFGGFGLGTSGIGFLNDLWKIYSGNTYKFVGTGYWSDAGQWENNLVAPTTIAPGMFVTIDHLLPGECINEGQLLYNMEEG